MVSTTACKWDVVIPFNRYVEVEIRGKKRVMYEQEYIWHRLSTSNDTFCYVKDEFNDIAIDGMWEQLKRIVKPNGAIVMTASQPFTTDLINSNRKWFKYEWIWEKTVGGFLNCNYTPLKRHENILVFSDKKNIYIPQKIKGKSYTCRRALAGQFIEDVNNKLSGWITENNGNRFPISIIKEKNETGLSPTQKPVALFEYLIKTYTNKGDIVLDFTIGSGTTAIAAIRTNRNWIGIELDSNIFRKAEKRIAMEKCEPYVETKENTETEHNKELKFF